MERIKVVDGVRYKKRRELFETFDYRTIERHLTEMAAEGWILEKIDGNTWWYRQDEPQNFNYAVAYIKDYDYMKPTESQLDMDALCEQAGWKRVAFKDEAHIYCSDLENPVPLETDEWTRMETIKKSMRSRMRNSALTVGMWIFYQCVYFSEFINHPVRVLANYTDLVLLFMIAAVLIISVLEFIQYFRWCKKSEQSIAEGGECWNHDGLYNRVDMIPALWAIVAVMIFAAEGQNPVFVIVLVLLTLVVLRTEVPKWILIIKKHWMISEKRRRQIIGSYIAAALIIAIVLIFTAVLPVAPVSEEGKHENGWIFRSDSTFMASYENGYFISPDMDYEINQVKIDWIYPRLYEKFLKENADGGYYEELPESEAAAWDADKVLRLYNQYGDRTNFWVIIKDNYFAGIRINERNLTPEVKADILEKMGI